jgi:pimeloyl-ACP methyl ester carboxylesterase
MAQGAGRIGRFRSVAGRRHYLRAYDAAFERLPTPTATDQVTTRFGPVQAYRFGGGDRRPMVLLPGRWASTPMWAPLLPLLAPRRPVWCLDPLGEPGRSEQTGPIRGDDDQAAWLAESLAGLDLDQNQAHLVGAAGGGWLAVNAAVRRSVGVVSLSLLDPVGVFAPLSSVTEASSSMAELPGLPQRWRIGLLGRTSAADGVGTGDSDPAARLLRIGMREFRSHLPPPGRPTDAELAALCAPMLVVLAGRTRIHDVGQAFRQAHRLLSDAELERWPEAEPGLTGSSPRRVAGRVLTFANRAEQE